MNQTPSPETVIRRALEAAMRRVNTAEPGAVESYDASTCTATVQPLVMRVRVDESGERVLERAPAVPDAIVMFMGGGGMRLTFPLQRGDVGMLVYSSQPMDQWAALGREVDPKTTRHHHMSDAIFVPLHAAPPAVSAANGTAVLLEGSDIRLGDASATALATKADVQAVVNAFNIHTHPGVTVGAGATGTPTAIGNPTGTTKVKGT